MGIIFLLFPLITILFFLLIGILVGNLLLKRKRYHSFSIWIVCITSLLSFYMLYLTVTFLDERDFWEISVYLLPLLFIISSMILGLILLRKHSYVSILSWVMSMFLVVILLLLLAVALISDATSDWILGVLFNESLDMIFVVWAIICTVFSLDFSVIVSFYFKLKRMYSNDQIKYQRKYLKLYLYIAGLPSAFFLIFWFQYSVLDPISADDTFGIIVYLLTQIACAVVFYYLYLKAQSKSILRVGIYIVCNIMLGVYLTINKEYSSMTWLFSYYVLCFIARSCYEVKKSQQESIPEKNNENKTCFAVEHVCNALSSYVPLLVMIVCNLIIVACNRANLI